MAAWITNHDETIINKYLHGVQPIWEGNPGTAAEEITLFYH